MMAAVAFSAEGVLFAWHLHGRSMMDVQVSESKFRIQMEFLPIQIVACFECVNKP